MYINNSMKEFAGDLGAKKSMPGGGSAAAYAATMANSLAMMVANFTLGKKKYADYEEDIVRILDRTQKMSEDVMSLVDKDIEAFLPLSNCYKMQANTEEEKKAKALEMEKCLRGAAMVPMEILDISKDILDLHEELLIKGSVMLLSDVGVGAEMVRVAAKSAYININVNTKYMKDRDYADKAVLKYADLLKVIEDKCDRIYSEVMNRL
ncbi:Formiminotransferase-cyclodeaminase [Peptostreptococcus anaerobius 653-L]|uniref:Formiminotransferase-cyclodeaminase n=1 Tax=Peptostreptococcus anaerobius 653-L TaxID=596329 RepID=D3MQV1_9FIRM|nr:cyclodeaminase/cyclohydrolase family protein [Peptostreptococcus anaerobius]EFD05459.1 Formiminotransferase-cyclodeaminase [Peptostreptococcus anaerobius 653-L]